MKRKGLKVEKTVSVIEIMTAYKHQFKEETSKRKGDIHNFPEIICPINGDVYMTVDNKDYIITAGEMLIYAPNSYHILTRPTNATVLIVSFIPGYEKIRKLYNRVIRLNKEIRAFFMDTVEEIVKNVSFSVTDGVPELKLKDGIPKIQEEIMKGKLELFLLMLEKALPDIFHNNEHITPELSRIIADLENNISSNYTISGMAAKNMMSETKLKRLFREQLHTSPVAYFHKLKIDRAKLLLLNGENNITEISEALGFQSIHYFSRFFKKHTGACPTEYIKAIDICEQKI